MNICPALKPINLLNLYANGYFPMAESNGEIAIYTPEVRAIFPLTKLNFQKSLLKKIKSNVFSYSFNNSFSQVMKACRDTHSTSWITDEMILAYTQLHQLGYAHSVEVWSDGSLVGGLYGVALQGAFFGESMFNYINDSAKAAFYYLIQRLRERKYVLLDSQYINDFTKQLGAVEVPNDLYLKYLKEALTKECYFD